MRRTSALYLLPALVLAVNACGGGDGGTGGKGGGSAGRGGTTGSAGRGGTTGSAGRGGTTGSAGTTGGSGGATGGNGGATGGSAGATGGSGGATGGNGGAAGGNSGTTGTGGAAGAAGRGGTTGTGGVGGVAGASGVGGVGGVAGAGVGGVGGLAGAGVGGVAGGVGGAGGSATGGTGGAAAVCGTNTDPDQGLTCNSIDATGPCVITTLGTGSPPAATGGAWVAGTYDLTSRTVYLSDGGSFSQDDRRETVMLTGNGNNFTVQTSQVSGTQHRRQSGTVTLSGNQLTFTPTCPPPGDGGDSGGTQDYSSNGSTTITIYDTGNSGELRLDVYTKRP